jgi:hypothetical protein
MRRFGLCLLTLVATAVGPLHAQQATGARFQVAINPDLWSAAGASTVLASSAAPLPAPQARGASTAKLAAVGLLAGAGFFFGGAFLGGMIENRFAPCTCDDPGLRGALRGAVIVPQIGIPIAVHMASGGDASFGRTLAGSLVGGAAVAAVGWASQSLTTVVFGAPIGALIGSVIGASR